MLKTKHTKQLLTYTLVAGAMLVAAVSLGAQTFTYTNCGLTRMCAASVVAVCKHEQDRGLDFLLAMQAPFSFQRDRLLIRTLVRTRKELGIT
jgi:DMSO/TMAO reductase YedYZ heme-binding membrane subunit